MVRVKKHQMYRNYADELVNRELSAEGLVSSTLFSDNFEVSFYEEENPTSLWFNIREISSLEIL